MAHTVGSAAKAIGVSADIDRALADLRALRTTLAAALHRARGDQRRGQPATVCRIIESATDSEDRVGRE
ncbi:hypothetical protein [uncultured Mycobacterium sp.]|uniref:hypothetical protein n=1 Tax=uncultured Mycobacterium sp. TaxID=171292 RepID=UPI0035CB3054